MGLQRQGGRIHRFRGAALCRPQATIPVSFTQGVLSRMATLCARNDHGPQSGGPKTADLTRALVPCGTAESSHAIYSQSHRDAASRCVTDAREIMTKSGLLYTSATIATVLVLSIAAASAATQRRVMKPGGGGDPTSLINRASGKSTSSSGSGNRQSSRKGVGAPFIPNKVYTSPRV